MREQELKRQVRGLQEEKNMVELAVREYADLVRSLEGRTNTIYTNEDASSSTTLVSSLNESKSGLHKLLSVFADETSALEAEIRRLEAELSLRDAKQEVERRGREYDYEELGKATFEVEKRKIDDASAASIVSRYMFVLSILFPFNSVKYLENIFRNFSQQTTNSLQSALSTMKSRHASTLTSHAHQLHTLETLLHSAQSQSAHMRDALDELGGEMMREMSGRRREVALRLAIIGREERIKDRLEHFVTTASELDLLTDVGNARTLVEELVREASGVLHDLEGTAGEGRVLAAEMAAENLTRELESESEKRIRLEVLVGKGHDSSVNADESPAPASAFLDSGPSPPGEVRVHPIDTTAGVPFPESGELVQTLESDQLIQANFGEQLPEVVADVDLHRSTSTMPQDAPLSCSSPVSPTAPIPSSLIPPGSHIETYIEASSPQPHRLLPDLAKVKCRYDTLQRQFRDCHLALRDLQSLLSRSSASPTSRLAPSILQAALSRLDDYNEDARVELEIRIADEELTLRGYTALLSIPDALPSDPKMLDSLEAKVINFINGEEPGVRKALNVFGKKADDLLHDIAVLRQIIQEYPTQVASSSQPLQEPPNVSSSWSSWILGPRSPPASTPPPTFGNVMTTPRLRHSSSTTFPTKRLDSVDPFAGLGLRVPMPLTLSGNDMSQKGNEKRDRTVSMFMLGLGARSPVRSRTVCVSRDWQEGETRGEVGADVE